MYLMRTCARAIRSDAAPIEVHVHAVLKVGRGKARHGKSKIGARTSFNCNSKSRPRLDKRKAAASLRLRLRFRSSAGLFL